MTVETLIVQNSNPAQLFIMHTSRLTGHRLIFTERLTESCLTDEWETQGHLPGTLVCDMQREEKRKNNNKKKNPITKIYFLKIKYSSEKN